MASIVVKGQDRHSLARGEVVRGWTVPFLHENSLIHPNENIKTFSCGLLKVDDGNRGEGINWAVVGINLSKKLIETAMNA